MRTNVVLDDELIKKAFQYSKAKTKKDLIHEALKELIELRQKHNLRDIKGKIEFAENYNYKKMRRGSFSGTR